MIRFFLSTLFRREEDGGRRKMEEGGRRKAEDGGRRKAEDVHAVFAQDRPLLLPLSNEIRIQSFSQLHFRSSYGTMDCISTESVFRASAHAVSVVP